jgi:hypothetical protein
MISTPAGAPSVTPDPILSMTQVGGSNLLDVSTTDGSNRTQVIFQSAYNRLANYLTDLGYRGLIGDNLIVGPIPANTNPDPTVQSYISWSEFFDGTNYWPSPILPYNFKAPLKVAERMSGTNALFSPMYCGLDGIHACLTRSIYNRLWEWREDRLYLPGAVGTTDLCFRYIKGFPSVQQIGTTPWYDLTIPIVGCEDALAYYIAAEVTAARGPEFVADLEARSQRAADLIFNNQARADQRVNMRRRPRSGGSRNNYWYGL